MLCHTVPGAYQHELIISPNYALQELFYAPPGQRRPWDSPIAFPLNAKAAPKENYPSRSRSSNDLLANDASDTRSPYASPGEVSNRVGTLGPDYTSNRGSGGNIPNQLPLPSSDSSPILHRITDAFQDSPAVSFAGDHGMSAKRPSDETGKLFFQRVSPYVESLLITVWHVSSLSIEECFVSLRRPFSARTTG